MMKLKSMGLISTAMFLVSVTASAATLDEWNKALDAYTIFASSKYPQEAQGSLVLKFLPAESACDGSNTEIPDLMIDSDYFREVTRLAYAGNQTAAEIMFRLSLLVCSDGEHSEAMDIALGKLIRPQPAMFLSLLNKSAISDLDGILGNLGESFVDQSSKSIEELQLRYDALASVKNAPAIQQKCLKQLKKMIDEMRAQ